MLLLVVGRWPCERSPKSNMQLFFAICLCGDHLSGRPRGSLLLLVAGRCPTESSHTFNTQSLFCHLLVETTCPAGHSAQCYCWSLDVGPTGETLRRVHSMDCQFFSAFSAEMRVVWCCFCIVFCLHHKLPRGLFRFQALGHESSETQ